MLISKDKCVGCKMCILYCPVHAIVANGKEVSIDLDLCTECANCQRSGVCKKDAIIQQPLEWPRQVRAQMSNVKTEYKGVNGRGTEEMKTNDITKRFTSGYAGVAIELGRPSVSVLMRDVERMAKTVAKFDIEFEELNPVTNYLVDTKTGTMDPSILDERVISAIIEIRVAIPELQKVLEAIKAEAENLDTVFCLDVACVVEPDGTIKAKEVLDEAGIFYRPNLKVNVGLGHL